MLIDAPAYDYENENEDGEIVLDEENADKVKDYINSLI